MKISVLYREITKDQIGQRAFIPFTGGDKEDCQKLKLNKVSTVEIKQPRHPLHHRKFFALVKLLANNKDIDIECAKEYLKLKTGYFYYLHFPDDSQMVKTKSIAWENMSQQRFEIFYEKAVNIIAEILGCTVAEIERNIVFEI